MLPATSKVIVRASRQAIQDDLAAGYTLAEIWRTHIRDQGKPTTYENFRRRCHREGLADPYKPPTAASPAPRKKGGVGWLGEVPSLVSPASPPLAEPSGFKPMRSTLDGLSPNEFLAKQVVEARARKQAAMQKESQGTLPKI